jgi:hypothetical protein
MNRLHFALIALAISSATLAAQQDPQYQGTSTPPPDDTIVIAPQAKPPAGQPAAPVQDPSAIDIQINQPQPGQPQPAQPAPSSVDPADNYPVDPEGDMVQGAPAPMPAPAPPTLAPRAYAPPAYAAPADPDGDMVHPTYQLGEIGEGTTIRVRLLDRLSTSDSERGRPFRCQVASDVMQSGQVLIPAGSEIDGRVAQVSTGDHLGGHGSMHLQPEVVILADGSRYRLRAEVTGAPGSRARVGDEGAIRPGSRAVRNTVEYGGAVGAGVVTGAVLGGPVGALTGGLVGAGIVTTHILVSHPQATLEPGTTLLFSLTEPLQLSPATFSGN